MIDRNGDPICPYCGIDYTSDDSRTDGYMRLAHLIMECDEIPDKHHDYLNKPWMRDKWC